MWDSLLFLAHTLTRHWSGPSLRGGKKYHRSEKKKLFAYSLLQEGIKTKSSNDICINDGKRQDSRNLALVCRLDKGEKEAAFGFLSYKSCFLYSEL